MDKNVLVERLIALDNNRPRTKQIAIGVSSLGDCRRKVWHMNRGDVGTGQGTRLPAIMGTAIHSAIEAAFLNGIPGRAALDQPMLEHRVEIAGLPPATIDYYDPLEMEVVDWKTIKKNGIPYFVSKQKRWQVQVYGYLLEQAGFPVRTVSLVGIPRDGNENDIIVHSEPYNEQIALEALKWLADVQESVEPPAPERDANSWCKNYCSYFGELCPGKDKDLSGSPIVDEVISNSITKYKQLSVQIKDLTAKKDSVKENLEGVAGITLDGIKVSWTEMAGRTSPDLDAIAKLLDGQEIPMKQGAPSLRLNVK